MNRVVTYREGQEIGVLILGFGGWWRFLSGVLHLDLDLDMVWNLAWIFPEVFITLRSVEAQMQTGWNQYSSELESDQF